MQPLDFDPAERRHVVRADRGYWAFVPPRLPAPVEFTPRLTRALSEADRAIGALAAVGTSLPNPQLLAQALVRREAVLSSRIEGTRASLSDLVLFEVDQPAGHQHDDVREVFNYLAAARHVLDPDRRLPLSISLLREAHRILLTDVRGGYATPGDVRHSQNWIGAPGATLETAGYVPPPPERLWECLGDFEKHLHAGQDVPLLLAIAAAHYQFEAIHPFVDGNGRVGRLLVVLLLVEWGLLPGPLLDLSAYIEPRRQLYYVALLRVSTEGDWDQWYRFFLEAVTAQAREGVSRARNLQALRDDYRRRVATARSSGLRGALVDELFRVPAITIGRAAEILGVTHRAASQNIDRLVADDILVEAPSAGRTRRFVADDVLNVVEGRPLRHPVAE